MSAPASALLPIPRTRLIGRDAERAAACSRLLAEAVPLLTLTGPGGVGKTRLALAIADAVAGAFADGVVWVDLAPLTDPTLVPAAIATAIGLTPAPGQPIAAELAQVLRPRQTLLLLDNCEHVLADTAALVAALLSACPALQVLATSRAPLRVRGEHELAVDPLPVPPTDALLDSEQIADNAAVSLFLERARAVRPSLPFDAATAATVAAICRALDGLPLAIELAAARVKLLSSEALLAQMEGRLRLLRDGARDLPPRQQTMRDAIAWSYDLLTPAEQVCFRRLAVFAGGLTLPAAEAVVSQGDQTLDVLASLVNQSLLQRQDGSADEPRYLMLETVREFGLEQLVASGEEIAIRNLHAAWCLVLAEQVGPASLVGSEPKAALDRLEVELANLRAALNWWEETGATEEFLRLAVAIQALWFYRSHRDEGRGWLRRALARGGEAPTAARAKALTGLGGLEQYVAGARANAYALIHQGLAIWRDLDDARGIAHTVALLGSAFADEGDHARAVPALEEAAALLADLGDLDGVAFTRMHLGVAALDQGDNSRAETPLAEALRLFRQRDVPYGVASTLLALGWAAEGRGESTLAAARYAESLSLWPQVGSREGIVDVLAASARLCAAAGQASTAAWLLGAAAAQGEHLGYVAPPLDRARTERAAAAARSALGEERYAAAWAVGRALSPDQAVTSAAGLLADLASPAASASSATAADPIPAAAWPLPGFDLTRREREVLAFLCQRLTDPEIAARLFLSPRTASSHVANLLGKLGAANRREAASIAVRNRLV